MNRKPKYLDKERRVAKPLYMWCGDVPIDVSRQPPGAFCVLPVPDPFSTKKRVVDTVNGILAYMLR
jgi:hypothetical protein